MASSFEYLVLVKESAYGETMANPVWGTDAIVVRLAGPNRFTPRPARPLVQIPYGGGVNIRHYTTSGKFAITGSLTTELYASQAAFLLNWCATRINTGRTTPWTTTDAGGVMPVGDLASVTCYHAIRRNDGTTKRRKYVGTKVHSWRLEGNDTDQQFMLSLELQSKKMHGNIIDASNDPDAVEFPEPLDSDYPTDLYLFTHTVGGFTLDSVRSIYSSMSINVQNSMDARFFEAPFIYLDQFRGRAATMSIKGLYKANPDDRAAFEAIDTHEAEVVIDNGDITTTIQFNGNNVLDQITDDLPLDRVFEQEFLLATQWDNAVHEDLSVSVTENP
jgi:hypothetical protein